MAMNKESMVIIVDIGEGAEELTKQAAACSLDVIKNKIYNKKIDMLSFLLLRAELTENVGNNEEPGQYLNICEVLPGSQVPSWIMAKKFINDLKKAKSKDGDWIDALVVAIGIITKDISIHKARQSKIVLFHNFDSKPSVLDGAIVDKLNEIDSKLIIVSHNIHYIPDSEGKLRPQFKAAVDKSPSQTENEELALEMLKLYPSTILCNFNDALRIILHKELKRPWSWNTALTIGSRILIEITGVIAIKEETNVLKFQKKSKALNEVITLEKKFYSGLDELTDQPQHDRISGYMLGSTPMPYDPSLGQEKKAQTKRGIHFIGFVPVKMIPQEHFSGQSTYIVFPQKGKRMSAMMMDSLVRVMQADDVSILAWKVFNNGMKPKLVVLLPTLEHDLAGLSMIELSYHSQHCFWNFPKLSTKKNQPTSDQLAAIDELMTVMDFSPKKDQKSCDSLSEDQLSFVFLSNIREQHLMDYLSKIALSLTEGTFSTDFVKVPHIFQPKAFEAAKRVKSFFALEKIETPTKERLKKLFKDPVVQEGQVSSEATSTATLEEDLKFTHIGTVTPAEDFKALISRVINRMPNGRERAQKFHQLASEMRSVISDLLFKSMIKQNEKITKALIAYRTITIAADSSYDYNDWMRDIRRKVIERKMFDFWEEVIVAQNLGLCMEDDPLVEENFYNISKEIPAVTSVDTQVEDDESVEDLFGNM